MYETCVDGDTGYFLRPKINLLVVLLGVHNKGDVSAW
ncbi:hypothetical protein DAI22_05g152801 [Oryza sativa Japonica Group]|nr:hypothetical protein DAI22_05g152801 [Oryza sativa Japonica Group]